MIPRYEGRDRLTKRWADRLITYLERSRPEPNRAGASSISNSVRGSNGYPYPVVEISTSSNQDIDDTLVNTAFIVTAGANINWQVPAMLPGDFHIVTNDSGSSGDVAVQNPSAGAIKTLEPGDTGRFGIDSTGVYYAEGIAALASDPTAVHTDGSGEIAAVTTKLVPVGGDSILIEDSGASNSKKRMLISNLESILDHDALTNFVANEHIDWTGASNNFSTSGTITSSGLTVDRVLFVGTGGRLQDSAAFTKGETGSLFTFNIGNFTGKHGIINIGQYQGGTVGSSVSGHTKQLRLAGQYNLQYQAGNAVKLWIGDYSNDVGDDIYPIYCEDENNGVDFYVRNAAATRTAYFGGALEIDGDLNHDGSNIGFYGTTPAAQSAAYSRTATVVESRTLAASASATATNNNNVLAAIIADLQNIGILG